MPLISQFINTPTDSKMDLLVQIRADLGGSVRCLSDLRSGIRGFDPFRVWQHSFAEIDHEILSTVILSLLLIQEEQLSVSDERMCTSTG